MFPNLLDLGFLHLRTYGACMAVGFLLCWTIFERLTGRRDLQGLVTSLIVAGVVGSRLAYVIEHWSAEFAGNWGRIVRIDQGGLMFYGGLILALLVFLLWCRLKGERLLVLADALAVVLPLGHACGRLGCFFYGCCYGRLSEGPLAVHFPRYSPAWYEQVNAALLSPKAAQSLGVLPTQLFEAGSLLALFAALLWLYRRRVRTGVLTGAYLLGYGILRFALESLRGDPRASLGPYSISQAISLGLLVAALVVLVGVWVRERGGLFELRSAFFCSLQRLVRGNPRLEAAYGRLLNAYQRLRLKLRRRGGRWPGAVRLRYFTGNANFGDRLNEDLMRYFGVDFVASEPEDGELVAIGSLFEECLLNGARTLRYPGSVKVFGTGFMLEREWPDERFNRPLEIAAVRGRLTLERCQAILGASLDAVAIGDPGLLVGRIFPEIAKTGEYDVGVICHFRDADAAELDRLRLNGLKVRRIDILSPTRDFVAAVASCRAIVSSALHGLICADALDIPNVPMLLGYRVEGAGYKFRDYYSAFEGRAYRPWDLRVQARSAADVRELIANWRSPAVAVRQICDRLEAVFPYPRQGGFR